MAKTWIWGRSGWPAFVWNAEAVGSALAAARLAQGRLMGVSRLLDANLTRESLAEMLVEDGLTTSAIEGETLNPGAVRSSVARRLGLPAKGLPVPTRSVDGLIGLLFDATTHADKPLTEERLFGWHAALFPTGHSGVHAIRTGDWRGETPMHVVSGAQGREHVHFTAPGRERLEADVSEFLRWFARPPEACDGLVVAGIAHLWFVTLHPFEDGNGRLARAITDMAIARDEPDSARLFSLSARILDVRDGYHAILEKIQRGDLDITAWLVWFLTQIEAAAEKADRAVGSVLARTRFWLRHAQTGLNERQRKALNRMMLPGGFIGGMTTGKYVNLTKTSRATAQRELADLVEKGCLEPTGSGRSVAYRIRSA